VLGILAALAVPMYSSGSDLARTETMAVNVSEIRTQIIAHAGKGDVQLSAGGSPTTVSALWFRNSTLPEHAWTGKPLNIEVVTDAATAVFPAVKTLTPNAADAWYNATNGAFCVRVPQMRTDALTLETFNSANKCGATTLGQTTN
jgi:type II secretory pathway pseudopilin PulG